MNSRLCVIVLLAVVCGTGGPLKAETIFLEAESFQPSSAGWKVLQNAEGRKASRTSTLWGADGPGDAVATRTIGLKQAGRYRVWVRAIQVARWRGPFVLSIRDNGRELGKHVFDSEVDPEVADWNYAWHGFDADLPAGDVTLAFSKQEQKNCVGYVRHVDCLLLTTDAELKPDHLPYGPQTFVRVTIGPGYDRPVYLHLFADHYRDPWYAHYAVGSNGVVQALAPPAGGLLKSGERSPWANLTPTIYQDSGAALNFSIRHTYHDRAARFRATLEFGRAPSAYATDEIQVVKTFDVEVEPNGLVIVAPPDLESPQHVARLKRDREFADEVAKEADAFTWPTYGRRPIRLPFLVTASIGGYDLPVDAAVTAREQKTLDYFGFNGTGDRLLHGLWHMRDGSYCNPDLEKMRTYAQHAVEQFRKSGRKPEEIAAVMLMDEPTGQSAAFMASDESYRVKFREWLERRGLSPQDLLVATWDDVRPVVEAKRQEFPALHYYTQLFRTRALGDFLATQTAILNEAYGRSWPTMVNFSDGAIYHANFTGQGVDYFELLDADDQSAIWGEDWANNSSTFQCAGFNVALMQAAVRKRGQTIGHYLIAHANRTPWDIKTKAVSETARGVRLWMNYCYGPNWGSHEGGPAWNSHLWHHKPELWTANAEITREIGAVEDWLLTTRKAPAQVALLYSSSSDIWTMENSAYGHDRMHTWLALTHAQIPVDVVSERDVVEGLLTDGARSGRSAESQPFRVCYLSGPNLTRKAAERLKDWVEAGGTLWLTAGAAVRDEFNRPLETLASLLPGDLTETQTLDPYLAAGRFLPHLPARDTVTWNGEQLEVLSVKQGIAARATANVLAQFGDGSPAVASAQAGNGRIIQCGFLPGLSYIKPALVARQRLEQKVSQERAAGSSDQPEATNAANAAGDPAKASERTSRGDREFVARSYNPWVFSQAIRDRLLTPVQGAGVEPLVRCDTPLVDVVALPCDAGLLLAISNFSLQPVEKLRLTVAASARVEAITSVRHGKLQFSREGKSVRFELPVEATDFVMLRSDEGEKER